jgi:uncharacterized membrane protein YeaQ/YmgE (transglycosylase-associated protein family)
LSKIEPDRNNLAQASPRQYSFGKIVAIFLIVGPPTFGLLFYLVGNLGTRNGETIHATIGESFGVVFSLYGLLACYVVGFVPSLIVGFAYSRSYRHRTISRRLLVAAIIGAAVYFLVCALVLLSIFGGRMETDWPFVAYAAGDAAGAGAVSAFFCALIVEY